METTFFWKIFNQLPLPPAQAWQKAMTMLPGWTGDTLTPDYIKEQQLYKLLFSQSFLAKTALNRLDQRLYDHGYPIARADEMDFFQTYDAMGLNYFYFYTQPRIERLAPDDYNLLSQCLLYRSPNALKAALEMVDATASKIMAAAPDTPDQLFELFPSIFGEGRVLGKHMVLIQKSVPAYDSHGMLVSEEGDSERIHTMYSVKNQLEPILEKMYPTVRILLDC